MQKKKISAPWLFLIITTLVIYAPLFGLGILLSQLELAFGFLLTFIVAQSVFFSTRKRGYKLAWISIVVPIIGFLFYALVDFIDSCSFRLRDGCSGPGYGAMALNAVPLLIISVSSLTVQYFLFSDAHTEE